MLRWSRRLEGELLLWRGTGRRNRWQGGGLAKVVADFRDDDGVLDELDDLHAALAPGTLEGVVAEDAPQKLRQLARYDQKLWIPDMKKAA